MREIKYQVYIPDEKKIFNVSRITLHPDVCYCYIAEVDHEYQVDIRHLRQYICLHDKHGKEIYEGSVVKGVAEGLDREKIKFTGSVEWDPEDTGFYITNNNDKWPHIKFWFVKEMEIIGNKFENPELLK